MVAELGTVWTLTLTATQRKYLTLILSLAAIVAPEQRSLHRAESALKAALVVGLSTIARELEARAKNHAHFRRL